MAVIFTGGIACTPTTPAPPGVVGGAFGGMCIPGVTTGGVTCPTSGVTTPVSSPYIALSVTPATQSAPHNRYTWTLNIVSITSPTASHLFDVTIDGVLIGRTTGTMTLLTWIGTDGLSPSAHLVAFACVQYEGGAGTPPPTVQANLTISQLPLAALPSGLMLAA